MSDILHWLSAGDLRGDGIANQVIEIVIQNPDLLPDLLEGLTHQDKVVRGHTADALEKLARKMPGEILPHLPLLLNVAHSEPLPMVQMHLVMLFSHLAYDSRSAPHIFDALISMLNKGSAFSRSWAISSLCILARLHPPYLSRVTQSIANLQNDSSIAIRARVRFALELLTDPGKSFPKGWVKSDLIRTKLEK